jgi:uncharacterized protein YjbJ (UPF0337 family)
MVMERAIMDNNRIEGSVKQAKGIVEEAVGKLLGDAKLTAEGKATKVAGKIQNTVGSLSDALTEERK